MGDWGRWARKLENWNHKCTGKYIVASVFYVIFLIKVCSYKYSLLYIRHQKLSSHASNCYKIWIACLLLHHCIINVTWIDRTLCVSVKSLDTRVQHHSTSMSESHLQILIKGKCGFCQVSVQKITCSSWLVGTRSRDKSLISTSIKHVACCLSIFV